MSFFGTKLDIDENMELSITLRFPDGKGGVLFSSKARQVTEEDVVRSIGESKTAAMHIRNSIRKQVAIVDDNGNTLIPVTISAGLINGILTAHDAEIIIPAVGSPSALSSEDSSISSARAPIGNSSHDQLAFLRSLHEMSLQTIGIVTKSANESMAKVSAAQAESLKAITASLSQAQQSIERLGSLPVKIFEDASEKVEALLLLAKERAEEKNSGKVETKDVVSELKEIMNLATTMKGMLG